MIPAADVAAAGDELDASWPEASLYCRRLRRSRRRHQRRRIAGVQLTTRCRVAAHLPAATYV